MTQILKFKYGFMTHSSQGYRGTPIVAKILHFLLDTTFMLHLIYTTIVSKIANFCSKLIFMIHFQKK